jgi:hypothetical protein
MRNCKRGKSPARHALCPHGMSPRRLRCRWSLDQTKMALDLADPLQHRRQGLIFVAALLVQPRDLLGETAQFHLQHIRLAVV